jgi:Uma2 family endonuclease
MPVATKLMTTEELLAMPDDGIDRELIRGELREYPITSRGRPHTIAMANMSGLLHAWARRQPQPRGCIQAGDARVLIRRNPDTFVGVDLVYLSPEQAARIDPDAKLVNEPPLLVVEIHSPSDSLESIADKIHEYLAAGVALVWEVNPFFHTVTVHQPGARPQLFNEDQDLTAEPHLPGFRAAVSEILTL